MSHASATALCRAQKLQCELYPSRVVSLCLDPYNSLGFVLWCLSRYVLALFTHCHKPSSYSETCDIGLSCIRVQHVCMWFANTGMVCYVCSIYSGHHSILVPPSEVEVNPAVWLTSVSNYNGTHIFHVTSWFLFTVFLLFVFLSS
jgi:hypothetical protein